MFFSLARKVCKSESFLVICEWNNCDVIRDFFCGFAHHKDIVEYTSNRTTYNKKRREPRFTKAVAEIEEYIRDPMVCPYQFLTWSIAFCDVY